MWFNSLKVLSISSILYFAYINIPVKQAEINPLFLQTVKRFERIPSSHILKPLEFIPNLDQNYRFYSAYGVYFPKEFSISAHKDYQCSLCDGTFKAMMIPKYIDPEMAQVCFEGGCEDAIKGYYLVDVCQDHWTKMGIVDRIQINLYYTNSTKCTPLGALDEFDCEASQLEIPHNERPPCTTTHPFLVPLVEQRDLHWDD